MPQKIQNTNNNTTNNHETKVVARHMAKETNEPKQIKYTKRRTQKQQERWDRAQPGWKPKRMRVETEEILDSKESAASFIPEKTDEYNEIPVEIPINFNNDFNADINIDKEKESDIPTEEKNDTLLPEIPISLNSEQEQNIEKIQNDEKSINNYDTSENDPLKNDLDKNEPIKQENENKPRFSLGLKKKPENNENQNAKPIEKEKKQRIKIPKRKTVVEEEETDAEESYLEQIKDKTVSMEHSLNKEEKRSMHGIGQKNTEIHKWNKRRAIRRKIKKAIGRFLTFIIVIALIMGLVYVGAYLRKEEPKTMKQFLSFANDRGYSLILDENGNSTGTIKDANIIERNSAKLKNKNINAEFYIIKDDISAQELFENMTQQRNIFSKAKIFMENKMYLTPQKEEWDKKKGDFKVYVKRNRNTIFYVYGPSENEQDVEYAYKAFSE